MLTINTVCSASKQFTLLLLHKGTAQIAPDHGSGTCFQSIVFFQLFSFEVVICELSLFHFIHSFELPKVQKYI